MAHQSIPKYRSTIVRIDLNAIAHNVKEVRRQIGSRRDLMAVVKADAYGHGAEAVSRAALDAGANCLAVALPEEGMALREARINAPVLVFGSIQPEESPKVVEASLEQTVCSIELAESLNQTAKNSNRFVNIHIKVDTGMGRIGVAPKDALTFIRQIKKLKNLKIKGVFSHFSSADERDKTFTQKQISIFDDIVSTIASSGIKIQKQHIANSAGIIDHPKSYYDLVRPGLMLYGLSPSSGENNTIKLKPAMTFMTKITHMKWVPSKTPISYGRSFHTQKKSLIATLPVGYADGYNRLLSNRGHVMVGKKSAKIVGRICMDMCMIDLTENQEAKTGDWVVLFGESPTADSIASLTDTINYEVVCTVGKRVPRIFV